MTRRAIAMHELAHDVVTAAAAKLFPAAPMVDLVPLRGGLEAAVARITLRDAGGKRRLAAIAQARAAFRIIRRADERLPRT